MNKISVLLVLAISSVNADTLLLDNGHRIKGQMTEIANDYIEFKAEVEPGQVEWLKVMKKDLLAVMSGQGRLLYPRDKFDENSLNWGRVPLRNSEERQLFEQRKKQNQSTQQLLESKERDRYKVAALVGSLSGIMLWALIDNK